MQIVFPQRIRDKAVLPCLKPTNTEPGARQLSVQISAALSCTLGSRLCELNL
jgi:hypothetical protein